MPSEPSPGIPLFPCIATPQGKGARLVGLYNQRQPGLLMQRIRIPGGRLAPSGGRAIADLADRLAPGNALHLTTRQDVEFHGVRPEYVPGLQSGLRDAGLSSVGACGDTLRNITLCPGCPNARRDLFPLLDWLQRGLTQLPGIFDLPRKFKISLSACPRACARPYLQDLGFVARGDDGFTVVAAGSLGPRPRTGISLDYPLAVDDLLPLARAALRLFAAEGDRERRHQARLRHVRERLGDAAFHGRLETFFREARCENHDPAPGLGASAGTAARIRLGFLGGEIEPATLRLLADACEAHGEELRIGFEHDVFLPAGAAAAIPDPLRPSLGAARIVACPGSRFCQRGIADTFAAADAIQPALASRDVLAGISGCPNRCAHSAATEISLLGQVRTISGERQPCFRLLLGGENGRGPGLGWEAHPGISLARLGQAVEEVIGCWQSDGRSFAEFCAAERIPILAGLGKALGEDHEG